jgi:hypothetical protein
MSNLALKAVVVLALPVIVFVAGALIMQTLSGRKPQADDRKPLNQRFGGYDSAAVSRHWTILREDNALDAERSFLKLDLVFPLLYGGALAASLLIAWQALGLPFGRAWLIAPVAVTVLSDWTENLVQLGQLRRFMESKALQASLIQIASAATILKLLFFTVSFLMVVGFAAIVFARALKWG